MMCVTTCRSRSRKIIFLGIKTDNTDENNQQINCSPQTADTLNNILSYFLSDWKHS